MKLTLLFVTLWVGICWGVGGSVKCSIYGAVSFTFSLSFTITVHCSLCVSVCSGVAHCATCATSGSGKCDSCDNGYVVNTAKTCDGQFNLIPSLCYRQTWQMLHIH